jgi:hypothetical protein
MINWKEKLKERIKKNLIECREKLHTEEYKEKIRKWCEKFGFDFEIIFAKSQKDDYFRAFFSKDPKKQNFYEKTLADYIRNLQFVFDFRELASSGKDALYLDRGMIRKESDYFEDKPAKSIDFCWKLKDKKNQEIKCYAFHKYIEESGGAQDNQFFDIKNCIEKGRSSSPNPRLVIFFICDGEYFSQRKIEILKNLAGGQNFQVLKSEELIDCLAKIVEC